MKHIGLSFVALLVAACAATPINVKISDEWPAAPTAYDDAYNQWTRHSEASSEWVQVAEAYATLESTEFRAALTADWARRGRLSDEATAKAMDEQRQEASQVWQVELLVSTEKYEWDDFASHRHSLWRIVLVGDQGREVVPTSIEVDKREHEALKTWFKGMDPFKSAYIIRFPKVGTDGQPLVHEGAKLVLKIGSPMGAMEMTWGNGLSASTSPQKF